jgi:phospholipase/carboxylesterase
MHDLTRRSFVGAVSAAAVASKGSADAGLQKLGLRADRDALLYIPESSSKFDKAPLVVSLHGATRNADRGIELLQSLADEHGFLLLAPASEAGTWDAIGLANGDGFIVPGERAGKPPLFISHGTIDNVLPIDQCSRRIVPQLKREGYNVTYREFEGKHTLPPEVAAEAMRWFMDLQA